jgi:hypothetical protein
MLKTSYKKQEYKKQEYKKQEYKKQEYKKQDISLLLKLFNNNIKNELLF